MSEKSRVAKYVAALLLLLGGSSRADDSIDYVNQIKPVLRSRCYSCHGVLKQEGGLRLDTAAQAIQGGDSGAAIQPGDPGASLLIARVTASDEAERMPLEGQPLKPEQIELLRAWIAHNAPAPADEAPEPDPRAHWAFRPIVRPAIPPVANSAWARNPIDAFVAQRYEQLGLKPQPEAAPEVLVRRLCFDLIGLPPTADDLRQIAVTSDPAATGNDWYEPLVDQLLADPRHGERWARHWMDVWRYSDWWGLDGQLRNSQRHVWHWREWIVESLNHNTPYDEMVRQMLAADELYPNDLDKLRATGFLARNFFLFNRNQWMEETVEHVSKAFLGLTMNCAKCHDHKYDPIAQVDFYRMRAIFEPYHVRLDVLPGEGDVTRDGIPRVFDGLLDVPTYRLERGQEGQPDKSRVIAAGMPKFLIGEDLAIEPVTLPAEAWQPERRAWVVGAALEGARRRVAAAEEALAKSREKLETAQKHAADSNSGDEARADLSDAEAESQVAQLSLAAARCELASVEKRGAATRAARAKAEDTTDDAALAETLANVTAEAVAAEREFALAKAAHSVPDVEFRMRHCSPESKSALEKELNKTRESLTKAQEAVKTPIAPTDGFTPFSGAQWTATRSFSTERDDPEVKFPATSTGRRSALARWITDRRNPLAARVAVNHIWARHMGTPLVASVFDFGRKGTPPTHPELLDWLAAEWIDSGWDMKHLHRLIVGSATYRTSSSAAGADENRRIDPDNRYLWRRVPIRIEAEALRDSILALAGILDPTRGGPPVPADEQADSNRRGLYFYHSNNERNLFLTTFDEAAVNECYRREQSIIPQQSLALSNSRLVQDNAARIARRLSRPASADALPPSDQEFVKQAYYELLGIRVRDEESRACLKTLEAWRQLPPAATPIDGDRSRELLIWALMNHNDFVTLR